jgi:L-threonylcarbamoyladenylate synthase
METKKLTINDFDTVIEILKNDGVVAIPTDTVYGLAALTPAGFEKVFQVKNRNRQQKVSWLVEDIYQKFSGNKIVDKYGPKLITYIGEDGESYRQSLDSFTKELLHRLQKPITGTSANLHDFESQVTADGVLKQLDGKIDAIIIADEIPKGGASTVIQLNGNEKFTVIRQGNRELIL